MNENNSQPSQDLMVGAIAGLVVGSIIGLFLQKRFEFLQ